MIRKQIMTLWKNSLTSLQTLKTIITLTLFITAIQAHAVDQQQTNQNKRPNFHLIAADDMGYADTKKYGSENKTPEQIHLAQQDMPLQEIESFDDAKKAARQERVEKAAKQDATGNDPRVFSNKWMPIWSKNSSVLRYQHSST
jgi:hypothetical protein